jgi:deoxyribodipyrimidine photolyase
LEYKELLEEQGLSEEQIKTIVKAMRKDRIFITHEEKIEERYQKMKHQRDLFKKKLELTENTIKKAQRIMESQGDIQQLRNYYEERMNSLKQEYEEKIIEIKIEEAIKTLFVNTKYPELLAAKFDKSKVTFDSNGKLIGVEEQLSILKREYKDLFIDLDYPNKEKENAMTCFNLVLQTDLPISSCHGKSI